MTSKSRACPKCGGMDTMVIDRPEPAGITGRARHAYWLVCVTCDRAERLTVSSTL
jgi:hypothetical protein